MNEYRFNEFRIRPDMVETIALYVENGYPPGNFLMAVLSNDLSEAVRRADKDNLANIPAFVAYLYNETPAPCWGSRAKVEAWLKAKNLEIVRSFEKGAEA